MLDYTIGLILTLVLVLSVLLVIAVLGKTLLQFLLEPINVIINMLLNR